MNISHFNTLDNVDVLQQENLSKLLPYREQVKQVIENGNMTADESSLSDSYDQEMLTAVTKVRAQIGEVSCVLVVGIGGSNLGTEAVASACGIGEDKILLGLDMLDPNRLEDVLDVLTSYEAEEVVICVVSKSGNTTETLSNATVLLEALKSEWDLDPYSRTVFIGNNETPSMQFFAANGAYTLSIPDIVGGRYSVFTAVGIMPLSLLGIDVVNLLQGARSILQHEKEVAENASWLKTYHDAGFNMINIFSWKREIESLGAWYRQLSAESLGKQGDKNASGFAPLLTTPVELHSVGQLYFSGFPGIVTDFLSFTDTDITSTIPDTDVTSMTQGRTLNEVANAIQEGVLQTYRERGLPFRITVLDAGERTHEVGKFMAMRMLETMYLANLMEVNAFNQPNVELYKSHTRAILEGNN